MPLVCMPFLFRTMPPPLLLSPHLRCPLFAIVPRQMLLTIRGFSEATVGKVQAAAAKVDKSGSSGMFQTGLECRVARQKVIKVTTLYVEMHRVAVVRQSVGEVRTPSIVPGRFLRPRLAVDCLID